MIESKIQSGGPVVTLSSFNPWSYHTFHFQQHFHQVWSVAPLPHWSEPGWRRGVGLVVISNSSPSAISDLSPQWSEPGWRRWGLEVWSSRPPWRWRRCWSPHWWTSPEKPTPCSTPRPALAPRSLQGWITSSWAMKTRRGLGKRGLGKHTQCIESFYSLNMQEKHGYLEEEPYVDICICLMAWF